MIKNANNLKTFKRQLSVVIAILMGLFCNMFLQAEQCKKSIVQQDTSSNTAILSQMLLEQGVKLEQIQGFGKDGIPLVCGYTGDAKPIALKSESSALGSLPNQTRGWETIPNVIRTDGIEKFRIEVNVNGPVNSIILDPGVYFYLVPPEPPPVSLHDNGLCEDRIAGDYIYTAGPFYFNTSRTIPDFFNNDPASPEGLYITDIGTIIVEELDGSETQFLCKPDIGFLSSDIPAVPTYTLSSDIIVSPHLINIRSSTQQTQKYLRNFWSEIDTLTIPIYEVLPDRFDFFMFFSTNKIERLPRTTSANFVAGCHFSVKVDYSGTGLTIRDSKSSYGSGGRLSGVNLLDALSRGITAETATHEILHQWSAFISTSLGLSDSTCHYLPNSSVASLLGGFQWIDNGDTTFTVNCDQGQNGNYYIAPLDKYMMGLLNADDVPDQYVYTRTVPLKCGVEAPVTQPEICTTVTINDIIARHGIRNPGPEQAKRTFNLAFLAETHNRFLNETEFTFYDILAEHYTKEVPSSEPSPYIGWNWPTLTRYFGEPTRWCSHILPWADLNLDLIVNFEDFAQIALYWLTDESQTDFLPYPNGDGIVNQNELKQLSEYWLCQCP